MTKGISVVVPTHGRVPLIEDLLTSIARDAEGVDFAVEVVLVDDSALADAASIRNIAARFGAVVYDAPNENVGGKRNLGVCLACYDLILFLDSDVTIQAGMLAAHVARLSAAPSHVAGCLGKVVFHGERTFAWDVIAAMQLTLPFSYPDFFATVPWGPTANLSVRRGPFLEVGGFDTTLPRYGGEDVDLGLRLGQRHLSLVTAPDAVARHSITTWSTWGQNIRRLWSFGLADYHLLIRHSTRSFVDFPTGPMLWTMQLVAGILLVEWHGTSIFSVFGALMASFLGYQLVYAALKRQHGSPLKIHLLGPFIFWIMDFAKTFEAVRHRRPGLIFRRLLYLDDLIAQDWREIAATAWALSAAGLLFVVLMYLFGLGG